MNFLLKNSLLSVFTTRFLIRVQFFIVFHCLCVTKKCHVQMVLFKSQVFTKATPISPVTHKNNFSTLITQHNQKHIHYTQIMKLVVSVLAAAASVFADEWDSHFHQHLQNDSGSTDSGSTDSGRSWTSHSNYQACTRVQLGTRNHTVRLCKEKFYTVSYQRVLGEEIAETCANINAFPWCPESEKESIDVYANLVDFRGFSVSDTSGWDYTQWETEGGGLWTGVELHQDFVHTTNFNDLRRISNYSASERLKKKVDFLFFAKKNGIYRFLFHFSTRCTFARTHWKAVITSPSRGNRMTSTNQFSTTKLLNSADASPWVNTLSSNGATSIAIQPKNRITTSNHVPFA